MTSVTILLTMEMLTDLCIMMYVAQVHQGFGLLVVFSFEPSFLLRSISTLLLLKNVSSLNLTSVSG